MNAVHETARTPQDKRASIAIDLGAESCRVSLLRWLDGAPQITMVHRFANGPLRRDGLRWPLRAIEEAVDEGLRRCAAMTPEGVRSVAVDGWAVDYVRLDAQGNLLAEPFCYRDERTLAVEKELLHRISIERLHAITGVQSSRINTLYQLCADDLKGRSNACWRNLPEYMLTRWGADPVAEYTNATHTQMIDLRTHTWSEEIAAAAQLDIHSMPRIVVPGTRLGKMTGEMAELPAFHDTELIAPACHDTASAVAGIPAMEGDWAYISSGTWSLIGTLLASPCIVPGALEEGFTNLGAIGDRICFHKGVSGMWLLKQCMEAWATADRDWEMNELIAAASSLPAPEALLDVDDSELLLTGEMPRRINHQLSERGLPLLDESPAGAPTMAALIFHSLAAAYAATVERVEHYTQRRLQKIVVVGGGSRNEFLCRLTAERTGRTLTRGPAESSTIGNLAIQLAALESNFPGSDMRFASEVSAWAATLLGKASDYVVDSGSSMIGAAPERPRCTGATC